MTKHKENGVGDNPTPSCIERIKEKKGEELAGAAAVAVARRRQERGERAVFIKAEKQCEHNGQATAAENVGTENAVF